MKRHQLRIAAVIVAAAATIAAVFVFCAFYRVHDPSQGGTPKCMFRLLTGYDCPGCGAQRAFHALLNGEIGEAWAWNPFLFFAVPAALYFIVVESGRRKWPRLHAASTRPWIVAVIIAATLAWWIGRNIFV